MTGSVDTRSQQEGAETPATRGFARRVTDILEPKTWIVAVLLLVGIGQAGAVGAAWAMHASLFAGVIPMLVIKSGVRRGKWTDRHLSARAQRLRVIPLILASLAVGIALMWVGGAPRELEAVVAVMAVTLAAILAITTVWKISVHTTVASGAVAMIALALGAWWWTALVLAALVGWSRIVLRDHTPAQVVAGAGLGFVLSCSVFTALA